MAHPADQRRRDRGQRDAEAGGRAEIVAETVDQVDDAGEGGGFFDVEIDAVEGVLADEVAEEGVILLEVCRGAEARYAVVVVAVAFATDLVQGGQGGQFGGLVV